MLPRPVDLSTVAARRWVAAHRPKFLLFPPFALVAQLDRALDYGSGGWGFESSRARHLFPCSAGGALDLRSPAAALPWPIEGPIYEPFGRGALDRRPREGARALSAPRLLGRRPKVLSVPALQGRKAVRGAQDAHQPETVASTPPEERLRAVPHGRHRPKPQETGQAPRPARGQARLKDEKRRPERKTNARKNSQAKTAPPKPTTFSTASSCFGTAG